MRQTAGRLARPLISAAWILAAAIAPCATRTTVDLDGDWQFRTDPLDVGRVRQWFLDRVGFPDSVRVPACWQAQGIGQPSGVLRHHYAGVAWYRRTFKVPVEWKDRRVTLRIGGALRDVELFVNGTPSGTHSGMSAPFEFDISSSIEPGVENVFALRVAIPKGSPETAAPHAQTGAEPTGMLNYLGNWGGIYAHVTLIAAGGMHIDEVVVAPDVSHMIARFRVAIAASGATPHKATLRITVPHKHGKYQGSVPVDFTSGARAEREVELSMRGAHLWTPDEPVLYTAEIALEVDGVERDRISQRFGMRQITTRGDVLLLNGNPLYLRGFGDDNIEVLTGTPPASKEIHLQRLKLARSFGFNAVRFHSMTPSEDYFEAADEAGILVMAELPAAYTMYFLPHKEFLRGELKDILRAHRNHPSFLSIAFGNELNPEWIKDDGKKKEFFETIADFYKTAKAIDPTRIVLSNDGILLRPTDLMSLYEGTAKDVPSVRHEFGKYYCSLPDISLIGKFTGVVEPVWLEAKKKWVEQHGLTGTYPAYVRNSMRLQRLGWKHEIEQVRHDNGVTGYHYWLIVDYPGGTGEGDSWEEGWFDYFWTPKGITPEEGREWNSAVLPLIDAGPGDRAFWADSGKTVGALVSNYSDEEIKNGTLRWKVLSGGQVLRSGQITGIRVPQGKVERAGEIALSDLPQDKARQLDLVFELDACSTVFTNRWSFWSFPKAALLKQAARPVFSNVKWDGLSRQYPFVSQTERDWDPKGLLVAQALDRDVIAYLKSGGRVLLLAGKDYPGARADLTYLPSQGAAIGTMIQDHPALAGFPHSDFADLQFYNAMQGAAAVPLDRLPAGTVPILGAVRTASGWLSEKKDLIQVAQLYEVKVGKGKLLAATLRIRENFDEAHPDIVSLFDRMLRYAVSDQFEPKAEFAPDQLASLE